MRRREKFNIWIAYSDLFTNLSTFLFISALGVFAGIGSGVFQPLQERPQTQCADGGDDAMVREKGSLFRRVDSTFDPRADDHPCRRYFVVEDYLADLPHSSSLRDERGRTVSYDQRLNGICLPLWQTVGQHGFTRAGGKITIIGYEELRLSSADRRGCPIPYPTRPIEGFPPNIPTANVIEACRDGTRPNAFPAICPQVRDCLGREENDRRSICRQIVHAWNEANQIDQACRRQPNELRALRLYLFCSGAPQDNRFDDQRLEGPDMVPQARRQDQRSELWQRVSFDSMVVSQEEDNPRAGTNSTYPQSGSIILEVEYGRSGLDE